MKNKEKWIAVAAVLIVAGVALWWVLFGQQADPESTRLLLDGKEMTETTVSPGDGNGMRVVVRLNDTVMADLPFGEAHTLQVKQKDGYNTIRITEDAVYMEDADCQGQDCVKMSEITKDNLETRVMRDMIICLPHHLSVQVTE